MPCIDQENGKDWTMYRGDCVEVLRDLPDESMHYSIFSPPFSSLFTYSDDPRDMGNCANHEEFFEHYAILAAELLRVVKPGRCVTAHIMNLPTSKTVRGRIGLYDFRGDMIRAMERAGFVYYSEVTIWKDPVQAMYRSKALGLLYKTIKTDSCRNRAGLADYMVTFRKPGDNPEPVEHTPDQFPLPLWQKLASPVWMDIHPQDVLNVKPGRARNDEKHMCPTQLEALRRCLLLYTNPGDVVLSPFGGIGSEGYISLEQGRKYLGIELKASYWKQAVANLRGMEGQTGMFDSSPIRRWAGDGEPPQLQEVSGE